MKRTKLTIVFLALAALVLTPTAGNCAFIPDRTDPPKGNPEGSGTR